MRDALLRIFDMAEDRPDIREVARAALAARSEPDGTMRDALEELVGSMTDKAAFQEWTPRQIKAMDTARSALAARSEPGAEGLDVERLARAWWVAVNEPEDGLWDDASESARDDCRQWADVLVREYAALAETEPKP